jgi:hypothetical protein
VAIGLMLLAMELPGLSETDQGQIRTIVLASVLVSELIGPPLARMAIFRSGEAYATGGKL